MLASAAATAWLCHPGPVACPLCASVSLFAKPGWGWIFPNVPLSSGTGSLPPQLHTPTLSSNGRNTTGHAGRCTYALYCWERRVVSTEAAASARPRRAIPEGSFWLGPAGWRRHVRRGRCCKGAQASQEPVWNESTGHQDAACHSPGTAARPLSPSGAEASERRWAPLLWVFLWHLAPSPPTLPSPHLRNNGRCEKTHQRLRLDPRFRAP